MALWTPQKQFAKHEAGKSKQVQRGNLAFNDFGRPEAMFIYGNDRTTALEITVDIDMAETVKAGATPNRSGVYLPKDKEVDIVGANLLCPKCHSPLYIKGKNVPDGREIVIHWDKLVQSANDGLYRPLISIDGLLKCDYYDHEIVGGGAETGAAKKGVSMRCGWQGGIMDGRAFDHSLILPGK